MISKAVQDYIDHIDTSKKTAYLKILALMLEKLPKDFELQMQYNMPSFVVPLSQYPKGYHCDGLPLTMISLAAQKNHIAIYHSGLYQDKKLSKWFDDEYKNHMKTKLNRGKSCIRFTNMKTIPFELLGDLFEKMSVSDTIVLYESTLKNRK